MKKSLSILLSLILVVSSFWGALTLSANAMEVDYNDSSSWQLYSTNWINKPTVNGAGNKVGENGIAEVTDADVTLPDAFEDGKGIKINQTGTYAAAKLENIIAGRAYKFSFKFMLPNTVASQGGRTIFAVYLAKEGATVAGSGVVSDTYNANASITIDDIAASSGNAYNDGLWHNVSIIFTATEDMVTNGVYVGASYGGTHFGDGLFFDDFDFSRIEETTVDYNANSKWNLYSTNWISKPTVNGAGNKVGENGIAEVTASDVTLPDVMGDGKGIKINQTGTYAATKLESLIVGRAYNFSFKFMLPNTVASQGGRTIFAVYLAKEGATVAGSGVVSDTYNANATITIDDVVASSGNTYNDGAWHTVNVAFTATAEMVANGVYVGAAYGGTHFGAGLFFDDFDLTKVDETTVDYNSNVKWNLYSTNWISKPTVNGAGNKVGENGIAEVTATDIATLPNAMGDGKGIKINQTGTYAAAKLEGLVENTVYNFSFKFMIPDTVASQGGRTIFAVYLAKEGATVAASGVVSETYNSNAIITIDNTSASSGNGYNDGAWHNANIVFTATDDMVTNGVYVGAAYGGTHFGAGLFFDDFDLEKISATAIDYNNKANWQQYSNHTSFGFIPDIDGDGNDIGANWAASEVTETGITGVGLSDAMGDGKAFKVGGIATVLGARLQNLTVGDTYKFTFNYLIPAGVSGYSSYTLFEVYLAKHGAVVDAAAHTLDVAKETYNSRATITVDGKDTNIDDADRAANAENAWKTVSIEFTVTQGMVDNGVYLGISAGSWTGMMYADDFKLEKLGEDNGSVGYNDNSKWQLYSTNWIEKPTVNGAGNKVGENGIEEVTAADVTTLPDTMGDGKGIRIYQTGTYAAAKLEGLTVGKHYKFSFQFMIPDTVTTTSGRTMFNVYLAKHGATVGSNGAVNDTYNGEAVIKIADEEVSGGNAYNDGAWRTATVHFTATADMVASGIYVGASYGGTHFGDGLYFDDFDLKEVAEAPAIATGYNISTKWKLYSTKWITNQGPVDGVNGDNAGTTWLPVVTSSTPALPNAMGDGKALALQGTGTYAATKLEDLVAGKHYKFTFQFMIPNTVGTTSGRTMFNVYLAKNGATVSGSGVVSDTYNNNAIIKIGTQKTSGGNTYNDSTWRTVTVHFTATDSMVNNGVYVGASYGGTHGTLGLYLDDFDLQEVTDAPELVSGYNSSSKWQLYSTNWINKPNVNGAGHAVGQNGIAEVTAADVPTLPNTMGDGVGIRIYQTGTHVATNLDDLTAGKNYKFTFKFMVPDTVTSAGGRTIFAIYLAKHGATVATNGVVSNNYNSKALIKIGDEKVSGGNNYNDGTWRTATVHFTATQEMLDTGIYVGASYGGTHFGDGLYLDDFDLQEVADAPKIATGYNDSSLWQLYATNWINKPTVNGAGYKVGENGIKEVTASDVTLPDAMGDAQGIRIYQTGTYVAAKLENLVAGKHYKFAFKFMVPTTVKTTSGRELFAVYLAKHGATVATNGSVDNTYNSKAVILINNATDKYNDGVWRTATVHFTATAEMVTDGAYIGASYGGTHFGDGLYLDDFDMKEVAEAPAIPEGYNAAANWGIYEGSSATDKCPDVIDGTGVSSPAGTSAYVANNYDKNFTKDGAGSSLLINWHLHLYATKLVADTDGNALVPDQVYTLTFNYFVPEGSKWGESARSWASTGVFKEGTTVAKNGSADSYHKAGATLIGDVGKWNTFKVLFVAGEEPLYFGMKPTFVSGLKIYIDDFKVTKGDTRVFDTPENKYIINFEGNKQYIESKYTDRYQIKNGSLYYKPGTYDSYSTLNQATVKADEHPVYTLPVIPERVYKISYRVKIDPSDIANGVPDTDKAGLSVYSMGESKYGGNVVDGTPVGSWKTYTTHFSTGKYDRCLSFTFSMGATSSGVWFDDIVVELTDKKVFKGHGKEPIEEFEINFDDFNTNVSSPFTVVEKAPARDGVSSNALHILPVKDTQVTFNAGNHYAGIDDELLTIPCEPETVYKFSFWRYNEGRAPWYFAFYYNFDLNIISKNLFYLHKQKAYEKQWIKHELVFTTDPGQTSLDIWINAGTNVVETWIDDIRIEKLKTGVDTTTDLTYCEKMYDLTDNLSNYEDFVAGKAGVYKMKLDKDRFYTVAATFSGKAKMVLSFDGVNPMGETGRGGKPVIDINSNGERFGVSIYSGKQEYLYIIIKDTQNFKIENVKIFNSVSINGARRTMGYAEDPNVPPLTYDEIEDIKTK